MFARSSLDCSLLVWWVVTVNRSHVVSCGGAAGLVLETDAAQPLCCLLGLVASSCSGNDKLCLFIPNIKLSGKSESHCALVSSTKGPAARCSPTGPKDPSTESTDVLSRPRMIRSIRGSGISAAPDPQQHRIATATQPLHDWPEDDRSLSGTREVMNQPVWAPHLQNDKLEEKQGNLDARQQPLPKMTRPRGTVCWRSLSHPLPMPTDRFPEAPRRAYPETSRHKAPLRSTAQVDSVSPQNLLSIKFKVTRTRFRHCCWRCESIYVAHRTRLHCAWRCSVVSTLLERYKAAF